MKKVRKLTAATIKRLIAEEKRKLNKQLRGSRSRPKKSSEKQKIIKEVYLLLNIKKQQEKRISEFKKLHEVKRALKKSLNKRL